jgi:hypothetical protein
LSGWSDWSLLFGTRGSVAGSLTLNILLLITSLSWLPDCHIVIKEQEQPLHFAYEDVSGHSVGWAKLFGWHVAVLAHSFHETQGDEPPVALGPDMKLRSGLIGSHVGTTHRVALPVPFGKNLKQFS